MTNKNKKRLEKIMPNRRTESVIYCFFIAVFYQLMLSGEILIKLFIHGGLLGDAQQELLLASVLILPAAYGLIRHQLSLSIITYVAVLTFFTGIVVSALLNGEITNGIILVGSILKGVTIGCAVLGFIVPSRVEQTLCSVLKICLYMQFAVVLSVRLIGQGAYEYMRPVSNADGGPLPAFDYWDGSAFGTFPNQISLAYFFFLGWLLIYAIEKKRGGPDILFLIAFLGVAWTESLAVQALFFSVAAILFIKNKVAVIFLTGTAVAMLLVMLDSVQIAGLPLMEYVGVAREGRIGIVLDLVPEFFKSGSTVIFGYGYGTQNLLEFVLNAEKTPQIFKDDLSTVVLQDVFNVSILFYGGIVTFITYWVFMTYQVYSAFRVRRPETKILLTTIFIAVLWLGSFNQVWSVSSFTSLCTLSLLLITSWRRLGDLSSRKYTRLST